MALLENSPLSDFLFDTDEFDSASSEEQKDVEASVEEIFKEYCVPLVAERGTGDSDLQCPLESRLKKVKLLRSKHVNYLLGGLRELSTSFESLDASRTWICFWIVHALNLLGEDISDDLKSNIVGFLSRCQAVTGGFGGGPGQYPHVAPTYAAVMALCSLGTEEAYKVIDRPKLKTFLCSVVNPITGAVHVEVGGETDVRGAYCALAVSRLLDLDIRAAYEPVGGWLSRCQTYEGGFSGCPGMEAHGGYTFCAFAALILLGKERLVDVDALARWASRRQMRYEGGFQGRTGKLVDGCYSFWVGGIFPLLHMTMESSGVRCDELLCSTKALQAYVMVCCQAGRGGLIDKPTKRRDFYHSCYTLSGISVLQYFPWNEEENQSAEPRVFGASSNLLEPTHPLLNIRLDRAAAAMLHFQTPSLVKV
ncbi:protein farnesyltransferase subunit beta-like [Sycon ciliatum]|uniref:protein farnesyltransferase subunit beta-like n=1 Tax=Sycon ciliatum TaxID=27933 RepID=UPI0031F67138